MKIWIERPIEPRVLVLAWQAPDGVNDRRRWQIGELSWAGESLQFRYLSESELQDRNFGRSLESLRAAGCVGYPAFKFEPGRTFMEDVSETFERRMPPKSRADFGQYLQYFGVGPHTSVSTTELLGITEGRLPSDGFSLIDPLDIDMVMGQVTFEIAGYRHEAPEVIPEQGAQLTLTPEPENEWDSLAVAVYIGSTKIGFVNSIQAPVVGAWITTRALDCRLLRFNGRSGSPRAYALLNVAPRGEQLAA